MDKLAALQRRVQTLESQMYDLLERLSAYEAGTEGNPLKGVYVEDGETKSVAKLDFNAVSGIVRVTKVR